MEPPNGKALPTIQLGWDAESQRVLLKFDTREFKTWDFVVAVLGMAKAEALQLKQQAMLAALQNADAESKEINRIAQEIKRK